MAPRKILYWLARPYEADAWKRSDIPPSDEARRYCEFMPVYEDTPHAETATLDTDRFNKDFASIFGGPADG